MPAEDRPSKITITTLVVGASHNSFPQTAVLRDDEARVVVGEGNDVAVFRYTSGTPVSFSIGLDLPSSVFAITGSPITSSGTLKGSFNSQTGGTFFAAPSGADGVPSFRALAAADLTGLVVSKVALTSTNLLVTGSPGTGEAALTVNLGATGVTAGTYGKATEVPILTIDATGRVTAATIATITGGGAGLFIDLKDSPGTYGVANNVLVSSGTGVVWTDALKVATADLSGQLSVDGIQVVTNQQPQVNDPLATLTSLQTSVQNILTAMRTHGLIAPGSGGGGGGGGVASALEVLSGDFQALSGEVLSPSILVAVRDSAGQTVTTAADPISVTVSTGYTLAGTTPRNAANGIATFNDLAITGPVGTAILTFTSGTLTPTTHSVEIGGGAPTPGQYKFVWVKAPPGTLKSHEPTKEIKVGIADMAGNIITDGSADALYSGVQLWGYKRDLNDPFLDNNGEQILYRYGGSGGDYMWPYAPFQGENFVNGIATFGTKESNLVYSQDDFPDGGVQIEWLPMFQALSGITVPGYAPENWDQMKRYTALGREVTAPVLSSLMQHHRFDPLQIEPFETLTWRDAITNSSTLYPAPTAPGEEGTFGPLGWNNGKLGNGLSGYGDILATYIAPTVKLAMSMAFWVKLPAQQAPASEFEFNLVWDNTTTTAESQRYIAIKLRPSPGVCSVEFNGDVFSSNTGSNHRPSNANITGLSLNSDQWYHCVFTQSVFAYHAASQTYRTTWKIFIDGVLKHEDYDGWAASSGATTTLGVLNLIAMINSYMDDLRIYSTEIDAAEIARIYNSGFGTQVS